MIIKFTYKRQPGSYDTERQIVSWGGMCAQIEAARAMRPAILRAILYAGAKKELTALCKGV